MLVYGKYECFVMWMLYVCVLRASCGRPQCCVLHDLQFVNAGRGCKGQPQFTKDTEFAFAQTTIPTSIHTANIIFTKIMLMADKHNIPKGKMHSNCRLLPNHILCKITQRNNMRRPNTCNLAFNSIYKCPPKVERLDVYRVIQTININCTYIQRSFIM